MESGWLPGGSNVADSVLLCHRHHDQVHTDGIAITRRHHWVFTDPRGHQIR